MTPSGMRGVRNDALSIHFLDATLVSAFVTRWCLGCNVETAEGVPSGSEPMNRCHGRSDAAPETLNQTNAMN
jgi:hypothetical protein